MKTLKITLIVVAFSLIALWAHNLESRTSELENQLVKLAQAIILDTASTNR